MKILITGGTGFIGRRLCRLLVDRNHSLTVLSRNPAAGAGIVGDGIDFISDLDTLTPADRFDAIINLAGAPIFAGRWTERRKQLIRDSRIQTTAKLIAFIERSAQKPAVLISGSAVGYYGDQGDTLLDEASTGHDEFSHQLCRDWEAEAERARQYGVRVCLLRTGLVIGEGGGFLRPMLLPFRLGLGGRLGSGKQWMSWIHIEDHVAMVCTLLENPDLKGIFNATAPNPVTNREFTRTLAHLLRRPALLPVPAGVLRLLLGEMSDLLLGGQRVLPARFQQAGFQFRYPELEPALRQAILK
ncbi:MAG TPA: TIGR01777 family protein [Gammaproteobacteria bacterium]|nr:TIGR01777 family protein [Gammaproteobacteria bacterium]